MATKSAIEYFGILILLLVTESSSHDSLIHMRAGLFLIAIIRISTIFGSSDLVFIPTQLMSFFCRYGIFRSIESGFFYRGGPYAEEGIRWCIYHRYAIVQN